MIRELDDDGAARFAFHIEEMGHATSQYELGEQRRAAEEIARGHGMTFDQASRASRPPKPAAGVDSDDDEDEDEPEPAACRSSLVADEEASYPSTRAEIERVAAVKAALIADPSRSDRDIAREVGCSPTTAGRARAALGIEPAPRFVHGAQTYAMHPRRDGEA